MASIRFYLKGFWTFARAACPCHVVTLGTWLWEVGSPSVVKKGKSGSHSSRSPPWPALGTLDTIVCGSHPKDSTLTLSPARGVGMGESSTPHLMVPG